jgi:hypothetical protein
MPDRAEFFPKEISAVFNDLPQDRRELVASICLKFGIAVLEETNEFVGRGEVITAEVARHLSTATPELTAAVSPLIALVQGFCTRLKEGQEALSTLVEAAAELGETRQ